MESKNCASLALFLALNLLFFSMVTACGRTCPNPPKPKPTPNPTPGTGTPTPGTGTPGTGTPTPGTGTPGTGTPTPGTGTPTPTPSSRGRCPRDALKLGVCANVLGLINVVIGSPPTLPCCSLLQGLANLEAAICLCTAIRANILGINLNIPISLSLLLNTCGRTLPSGFQC